MTKYKQYSRSAASQIMKSCYQVLKRHEPWSLCKLFGQRLTEPTSTSKYSNPEYFVFIPIKCSSFLGRTKGKWFFHELMNIVSSFRAWLFIRLPYRAFKEHGYYVFIILKSFIFIKFRLSRSGENEKNLIFLDSLVILMIIHLGKSTSWTALLKWLQLFSCTMLLQPSPPPHLLRDFERSNYPIILISDNRSLLLVPSQILKVFKCLASFKSS